MAIVALIFVVVAIITIVKMGFNIFAFIFIAIEALIAGGILSGINKANRDKYLSDKYRNEKD